jgi:hypothetical protein
MIKLNFILILLIVIVNLVKTEQLTKKKESSHQSPMVAASVAVNGLKPLPLKIHKRELTEQQQNDSKKIAKSLEKKLDIDLLKYLELQKYNRDLITNELVHNNFNINRLEREYEGEDEEEEDGEYELNEHDDEYENDDDDEYYDQYSKLVKNSSKSKRSSIVSSNNLNTNNVNERKKQLPLEKYKKLLINLVKQKNSLYNTKQPIDTESFAKYMNDFYLSHHASKSNTGIVRPFKGSVLPTKDSREFNAVYLLQKMKRAACGNLNGNPMHKWICW